MDRPTHPLIRGIVMLLLCGGTWSCAGSPTPRGAADEITSITLERDCSGCPTGSVLVLGRDGEARRVLTGKARLGTDDQRFRATLRREDFDALARQALAAGFFTMAGNHEEPGLQDGPWSMLVIARTARGADATAKAEEVKQVFRRGEAGPPALQALEAAVEALTLRLQFAPDLR